MGHRISPMVGKCICFFPYDGENLHDCGLSVLGCSSNKVHGGVYFTTNCFGTLFWPSLPSFSITDCKVFFHQVLVLKHLFTMGPRISLMVENIFAFSLIWGKFAFLWPFLTLFFIVFLLWIFLPWAQIGLD